MNGLVDRAIVYGPNSTTGEYTISLKTNLRCRLAHVGGGQTLQDRAAMAEIRHLIFDISYEMPEDCEVLIDGTRWNPMPGTFKRVRGPNNRKNARAVDVIEVKG